MAFHFMLKAVRTDAGLGDPPREYTTNDCEASNFIVKHGLNFEKTDPAKFINDIKEITNLQFRNKERVVLGSGPYTVAEGFPNIGNQTLSQLTTT